MSKSTNTGKIIAEGIAVLAVLGGVASTLLSVVDSKESGTKSIPIGDKSGINIAVDAIMKSDMFDSHKTEAIKALKHGQSNGYYEAIATIANSDMLSSRILASIKEL